MSEKLEELYKAAYDEALRMSKSARYKCKEGSDMFLTLEREALATLLIRECMIILEEEEGSASDGMWAISEYFGIDPA